MGWKGKEGGSVEWKRSLEGCPQWQDRGLETEGGGGYNQKDRERLHEVEDRQRKRRPREEW